MPKQKGGRVTMSSEYYKKILEDIIANQII